MYGVGDHFPSFSLNAVDAKNQMITIESSDQKGWSVVYFYPKDFTFICPTEISEMDKLIDEGVSVFGISGDNEFCKLNWKLSNELISGIRHPLVADTGLALSSELGIVDDSEGVCLRATFIINEEGIIQHVSVNALDTGRNVNEVIRTLKGLQSGGLTGCSWNPGDEFVA
ncbi:MAG: peroxiredoxin [Gammaproteobacteria bacterium]|jgi:peroxiredoxin (alkyl hydroperoxide reductase subunit C)|nr:peroxiredoxin [Gammaproteobacteria bacterium]HJM08716.1 peroxiredoxin [Gammaproteobacteria bacterium]HJN01419.1 peroxiredoxin [Gammaproteobacteria bacterium]|tara:strand:- start:517 stop:1026 length:510 start_codon:yes stop_codon:yes gene_type:complete